MRAWRPRGSRMTNVSPDSSAAGAPGASVLLIDDETSLLDAMRMSLEREFEIELAGSAAEAELMMATRNYDVVVCDHLMPGEEGLQFLIRASERHPRTRRILLTGYMNPELLSRSIGLAQLSACLLKPIRAEEVAKAIRKALAG